MLAPDNAAEDAGRGGACGDTSAARPARRWTGWTRLEPISARRLPPAPQDWVRGRAHAELARWPSRRGDRAGGRRRARQAEALCQKGNDPLRRRRPDSCRGAPVAGKVKTWVWVVVGIAVVGDPRRRRHGRRRVLLRLAAHRTRKAATRRAPPREFDAVKARFTGQKPLIELDERGRFLRSNTDRPAPATAPARKLYLLAFDPDDEAARAGDGAVLAAADEAEQRHHRLQRQPDGSRGPELTVEDLERFGPTLIVDQRTRAASVSSSGRGSCPLGATPAARITFLPANRTLPPVAPAHGADVFCPVELLARGSHDTSYLVPVLGAASRCGAGRRAVGPARFSEYGSSS